jgi:hypothetical protein
VANGRLPLHMHAETDQSAVLPTMTKSLSWSCYDDEVMVVALPIATALNANTQRSISTARARVSIEVAAMDSIEKAERARVAMVALTDSIAVTTASQKLECYPGGPVFLRSASQKPE